MSHRNGTANGKANGSVDKEEANRLHAYYEEMKRKKEAGAIAETAVLSTGIGNPKVTSKNEYVPGKAVFVRLSDVVGVEYDWLWPGRIPIGEPILFYGDCDQGKSMLSIALASVVTQGHCWPDYPGQPVPAGSVAFVQDEDTLDKTVRPRVDAAGGDSSRIHALDHISYPGNREEGFSLKRHMAELEAGLLEFGDCRLLVIDPVSAYLEGVDENSNAEVRSVLRPLARMSRKLGIAVVMIGHPNKGSGTKAIYRMSGSAAFINAPRGSYLVATDPDDRERRLVAPAKFNLGVKPTGLAYRFKGRSIQWETDVIPGLTANSILDRERARMLADSDAKRAGRPANGRREAAIFLMTRLGDVAEMGQAELVKEAIAKGMKESTVMQTIEKLVLDGQVVKSPREAGPIVLRKGASLPLKDAPI